MKASRNSATLKLLSNSLLAMLMVGAVTVPLFLIGRATLGEGVIALLYLLPVTWSASRWGLIPGISAALTATLCFDFLFIPPFFTFTVGSLEGWLVLAIFLTVAIFVVERFQVHLTSAREAIQMYELSIALSNQRTHEAVAFALAQYVQQCFQATLVNVVYWSDPLSSNIIVSQPINAEGKGKPDRILPILTSWGLKGEVQVWRGQYMELPPENSRLMQNFTWQAARALERTQPLEAEQAVSALAAKR